jgi:hypothetical protein
MAERRAIASGFSLSEMATEGGCWMKVATGGGAGRGRASVRATGASWAADAVGVMGDTGGRFGDADSERFRERPEVDEASLDEAGRGFVSTRSAGMTARWTSPGAEPARFADYRSAAVTGQRRKGQVAQRPGGWSVVTDTKAVCGSADQDRSPRVAAFRLHFPGLGLARPCQK